MCLGCGRFWQTKEKLVNGKSMCPYCGDMYFSDNIILDKPKPLDLDKVRFECGHEFLIETGELKFCTFCGEKKIHTKKITKTLIGWQNEMLEELGI